MIVTYHIHNIFCSHKILAGDFCTSRTKKKLEYFTTILYRRYYISSCGAMQAARLRAAIAHAAIARAAIARAAIARALPT